MKQCLFFFYSLPLFIFEEQADGEVIAISSSIEGTSIGAPRYERATPAESAGIEGADDCCGTPCDIMQVPTPL